MHIEYMKYCIEYCQSQKHIVVDLNIVMVSYDGSITLLNLAMAHRMPWLRGILLCL